MHLCSINDELQNKNKDNFHIYLGDVPLKVYVYSSAEFINDHILTLEMYVYQQTCTHQHTLILRHFFSLSYSTSFIS